MSTREGSQPAKPAITVLSALSGAVENHVLAGIEEEGVPAVVERPSEPRDAEVLATDAAQRSSLGVGVGIDTLGRVCIQHEKLRQPLPCLSFDGKANLACARIAGHNAARIVVGIPLRLSDA